MCKLIKIENKIVNLIYILNNAFKINTLLSYVFSIYSNKYKDR